MKKLIDKSVLVVEIERMKKSISPDRFLSEFEKGCNHGKEDICDDLLSFLDTLEVKDVDLEKEINTYISDNFFGSQAIGFFANRTKEEPNDRDIALCAKHFFELGLAKAKGE